MRIVSLLSLLLFANSVYAQETFVYNDHSKRDPFAPLVSSTGIVITYDESLSVNDLVVEGVVSDASGNNLAIVNGKIVKSQDQIGPYTVGTIFDDHVEFLKGSQKFVLKVKKGQM